MSVKTDTRSRSARCRSRGVARLDAQLGLVRLSRFRLRAAGADL